MIINTGLNVWTTNRMEDHDHKHWVKCVGHNRMEDHDHKHWAKCVDHKQDGGS